MLTTTIYDESFRNCTIFQCIEYGSYWVFIDKISDFARPLDTSTDRKHILQRMNIQDGVLTMHLLPNDTDCFNLGLNRRTELRLNRFLMQPYCHYGVRICTMFDTATFSGEFIQLMSRRADGASKPLFQLEIKDEKFTARYFDQSSGHLLRVPFTSVVPDTWNHWNIRFFSNETRGYILLYMDGVCVWKYHGSTYFKSTSSPLWIQYGIYENQSTSRLQTVHFKYICINKMK